MDGRACGYIDHRTASDAFVVTTAIDVTLADIATNQVDDSRHLVGISQCLPGCLFHTQSSVCTGTKDLCALERRHALWDIDEDVAALLHYVAVKHVMLSLSGTVNFACSGQ